MPKKVELDDLLPALPEGYKWYLRYAIVDVFKPTVDLVLYKERRWWQRDETIGELSFWDDVEGRDALLETAFQWAQDLR